MITLTLSSEQAGILERVLRYYLGELRMEIIDTDAYAMRQDLKHEEEVLKDLIARLGQVAPDRGVETP